MTRWEQHLFSEVAFGERVRQWRIAKGWSQGELAKRLAEEGLEIHQTTIARIEGGLRPIRIAEASAIVTALERGNVLDLFALREAPNE